ncbi:MAG: hypothetical protein K5896_04895, partial [Prevotella sp.]|nr:hypothetical protein [Prevotella sp.]
NVVSMSIMSTSSFFFRMNGHQNEAFSCLIGALNNPRKVNGYGADYAKNSLIYGQAVTKSQEAPSRKSICKNYSKSVVE